MRINKIDTKNPPHGATHHSATTFYKCTSDGVWAWIQIGAAPGRWVSQERMKGLGLTELKKTNSEINEQARSDAIDKLADEIAEYHGLTGARVTHQELAMHLYELNYRRFEIMDKPA